MEGELQFIEYSMMFIGYLMYIEQLPDVSIRNTSRLPAKFESYSITGEKRISHVKRLQSRVAIVWNQMILRIRCFTLL